MKPLLVLAGWLAAAAAADPFVAEAPFTPRGPLDQLLVDRLARHGLVPAPPCSDAVFVRRVFLDLTGTLPHPAEVQAFLRSTAPDKRDRLVDQLLGSDPYITYWTMKWCDVLRVKAEYPINLWPNGVQAYARWIREAVRDNRPYDAFARELLTASGSNFRVPPVNFYCAVQGTDPAELARAAALTFMGTRLQ